MLGEHRRDKGTLCFSPWPEHGAIPLSITHYVRQEKFVTDPSVGTPHSKPHEAASSMFSASVINVQNKEVERERFLILQNKQLLTTPT